MRSDACLCEQALGASANHPWKQMSLDTYRNEMVAVSSEQRFYASSDCLMYCNDYLCQIMFAPSQPSSQRTILAEPFPAILAFVRP